MRHNDIRHYHGCLLVEAKMNEFLCQSESTDKTSQAFRCNKETLVMQTLEGTVLLPLNLISHTDNPEQNIEPERSRNVVFLSRKRRRTKRTFAKKAPRPEKEYGRHKKRGEEGSPADRKRRQTEEGMCGEPDN